MTYHVICYTSRLIVRFYKRLNTDSIDYFSKITESQLPIKVINVLGLPLNKKAPTCQRMLSKITFQKNLNSPLYQLSPIKLWLL